MTKVCLVVSGALALALIVLAIRPDYDLDVARLFYVGSDRFVGNTPAGVVARYAAWALPFLLLLGLIVATILARRGRIPWRYALPPRSVAVLALSMVLGPGLLVHATLKEISHRPRPYDITQFGGPDRFRPFDRFDGACPGNCSFPSGETAAATWMIAPASLAPPPWRGVALASAFAFAAATGGWRMAFGAHFLSDVCAAALITILVVLACRPLARGGQRAAPNEEH